MAIRIGNAPVSWGIYGPENPPVPYNKVLDAIAAAGYEGTELGPYGYYPTTKDALAKELQSRKLTLGSSFVGVPTEEAARRQATIEDCLKVGRLLATQGVKEVIVSDDDNEERMANAGRIPADGSKGWNAAQWMEAATTLNEIGRALRKELDMSVVIHHHVGTFLETPTEIDRVLASTDPELVNLLLDTGHCVYGGGDPLEVVKRHGKRIKYVHLKDVSRAELENVRKTDIHCREAWKRGVFCALGEGVVPFPAIIEELKRQSYSGWAIVEQDVVPDANGKFSPDPFESAKQSRKYLKEKLGI